MLAVCGCDLNMTRPGKTVLLTAGGFIIILLLFISQDGNIFRSTSNERIIPAVACGTDERLQKTTNDAVETTLSVSSSQDVHTLYDMKNIYIKRNKNLQNVCDSSLNRYIGRHNDLEVKNDLHLDQRHQLLYCQVQKVGSTFFRAVMKKINKSKKNTNPQWHQLGRLTELKSIGVAEVHFSLVNSFKFMFSREPYSRLLSGYVDKLFTVDTHYWDHMGIKIKNAVLQQQHAVCGHDITFPQYIKYVIHTITSGENIDQHFMPIYDHCKPCQIQYDFIGKMETFKEDTLFLLSVWNKMYGINVIFEDFESETAMARGIEKSDRLYQMKKKIDKCTNFYHGMGRVWKELQVRGLILKNLDMPFKKSVTKSQFTDAVSKAIAESLNDSTSLKRQKKEALIQAYRQVDMEDLIKLREIVRPDCDLFGYDVSPLFIFNRTDPSSVVDTFKFFDIET